MAQLVQLTKASEDIAQLFKANSQRMIRAAPKGFDPQRLLSVAFNAICYNTDLLQCTRESLIGGAFEALKLGLTLGGPMQEAWLVKFNNRRKVNEEWVSVPEATLIIGYQGFRNLLDRARAVLSLDVRAVHNGTMPADWNDKKKQFARWDPGTPDEFDYWFGSDARIVHRPKNAQPDYREQLQAIYVVAKLRGGASQLDVLLPEEIESHRKRSRAKDNGPWVTDYVPMAMKTGVRKIAKYLPKASLELARALDLDNKADSGESQSFDVEGFVITPAEPPAQGTEAQPPKRLEGLKQTMRVPEPAKKDPVPANRTDAVGTTGAKATTESGPPRGDDINWG
jgi:recombination protein RecT